MLADMKGGSATAQPGDAVTVAAGSYGTFLFALKLLRRSGQKSRLSGDRWTSLWTERPFHLVAAAPLSSGEQPRPVWVRHDPTPVLGASIGTVRLGE